MVEHAYRPPLSFNATSSLVTPSRNSSAGTLLFLLGVTMYPYSLCPGLHVQVFKECAEGDRLDHHKNRARLLQARPDAQMSYLENHLQPVGQDGHFYRTFWDWR